MPSDSQPPKREVTATLGEIVDSRYRITAFIGDGGMGSVYRAEHITIRKPVAIKLLHKEFAHDPGFAERFEREAMAAGRIKHPNCVEVSDFGKLDNGTLYLVMELVSGQTLGELLAGRERLPIPRAMHIARHCLRALAHAHEVGIVHRDVKPDNIILVDHEGDRDFAKLLDFGIAKLVGEAANELEDAHLTQVGTTMGTPKYMPPEQAFGKPVDGRADLYSLSVVLYMMIAGRPPFEADDVIDILMMHASKPPPPFSESAPDVMVPPEVEALVLKGLAKKRTDRFENATVYLAALEDALDAFHAYRRGERQLPEKPRPAQANRSSTNTAPAMAAALPTHPSYRLMSLPTPPKWARWLHRVTPKQWMIGIGSMLLLIIIIAAAASGSEPVKAEGDDSVDFIQKGATALTGGPSELAQELKQLNRDGLYASTLEKSEGAELDGFAHLERGHALAASERHVEALGHYLQALDMEPSLRNLDVVAQRASKFLGSKDVEADLVATELLVRFADDDDARAHLIELAGENKKLEIRIRARKLAQKSGVEQDVNLVRSYALDLVQERTCQRRRAALLELEKLGDARALQTIENARRRMRGGMLGFGEKNTNACLKDDADRIVKQLRGE